MISPNYRVNSAYDRIYEVDVSISVIDFLEVNTSDKSGVFNGNWIHGMLTFNKAGALRVDIVNPWKEQNALAVIDRFKQRLGILVFKEDKDEKGITDGISFSLSHNVDVLGLTNWLFEQFQSAECRCCMSTFER